MDYKRYPLISCVYHPQQYITNFCRDKRCLMPLCPYCIGEHSEHHEADGTKPHYQTIQESLAEVQDEIQNLIFSYEQDKARNVIWHLSKNQIILQIHQLTIMIHDKIVVAKNLTYKVIDDSFDELEKSLAANLRKYQQEINVYSLKKCQTYEDVISHTIQKLYYMLETLKTQNALSNLIQFHKQKYGDFCALHSQISHFLYNNENYTPHLQISHDTAHSLNAIISRMVRTTDKSITKQNDDPSEKKYSKVKYTNERSVTPKNIKEQSNRNSSRINTKNNDNSPYKSRVLKGINYEQLPKQSRNDYRNQYENISQRVHHVRRQNQMLSKILKHY